MTLEIELTEHREIESIIDDAKASGLYSLSNLNIENWDESCQRTTDDTPIEIESHENLLFYQPEKIIATKLSLSENTEEISVTKQTLVRSDSEVTVIRVKRNKGTKPINKWEGIHDKAVPGDGTHLGDSPSLVNLVTYVSSTSNIKKEAGEYLVPISSWDPAQEVELQALQPESIKSCQFHDLPPMVLVADPMETEPIQLEELHRSLHITGISNSRLNIPYMMKQPLSPRPGALFSQNNARVKIESEKNMHVDVLNDTKELQLIKPPPVVRRPTLRQKFTKLFFHVLCPCCGPQNDKLETIDMGSQTIDNESEYCVN